MQGTSIAVTLPAPRSGVELPARVPARELLDDSERMWSAQPSTALRCDDTPDSRHRRTLVLDALRAYENLRGRSAPDVDPLSVFRRWPACTVIAMVSAAPTTWPDTWLRGWAEAWTSVFAGVQPPRDVPGLAPLLQAAATGPVALPKLRLDVGSGCLVVTGRAGCTVEAGGSACLPRGDDWVVPRPVPFVTARDAFGFAHRLPLVDPTDPMIVFAADGRLVPPGQPLPPDEAWVLHLREPPAGSFDGDRDVLEEAVAPVGWSRWWLGRVCLERTAALRSAVDDGRGFGPWRAVHSSGMAQLRFGAAIPDLVGPNEEPVLAAPPLLSLPGTTHDRWEIEIGRTGEAEIVRRTVPGDTEIVVGDGLARPLLGQYRIRAVGAGDRITKTFTIAEGVTLESSARLRVLTRRGGLHPARVSVHAPAGLRSVPPVATLRPTETERRIELRSDDGARTLLVRVSVPHCALRARIAQVNGPWEVTSRPFGEDELAAGAFLDVRLPRAVRDAVGGLPELVAGPAPDAPVQVVAGRRATDDVYRYDLGKFADTVRNHGTLQVWLPLPGQEALVATVRADALASAVTLTGDRLQLLDRIRRGGVRLRVYSCFAPWLAPFTTELPDGVSDTRLPPPFLDGGPLLVLMTPTDGAAGGGWPDPAALPRRSLLFRVGEAQQVPVLPSPVAQAMARYLAGTDPLPDTPDALHLVWIAAARSRLTAGQALGAMTAQECAGALGAHPVEALRAAPRARLTTTELAGPLIRSGLAAHRFRQVDEPDAVRTMWMTTPLPALLLTSPLLPYLSGATAWDPAELEPDEDDLLAEVSLSAAGHAFLDVLRTGGLPTQRLLSAGDMVPEPDLPGPPPTTEIDRLRAFAAAHHPALFAVLDSRDKPAAALSIGCALVARLAAQGDPAAAAVERQVRHAWVTVADQAPDFVAEDVALAELLVAHHASSNEEQSA